MKIIDLKKVSFEEANRLQEKTIDRIASQGGQDTLYLLEHPHVFTVGRTGGEENLLSERDWQGNLIHLVPTNRGGGVTYHGPGQLIAYLQLNLRSRGRDVRGFLRDLEQVVLDTAADFGIGSYRRLGLTGVWTQEGKIASIGVGVRRWITMHGVALNVTTDLRYFQLIRPCGLKNVRMTSFAELLGRRVELDEVKAVFRDRCRGTFGLSQTFSSPHCT